MKKSIKYILIAAAILIFIFIIFIGYSVRTAYDFPGTYSEGHEPDIKNNRYLMVVQSKEFTLYTQEKILATGSIDKMDSNKKSNIYRLVSKDNDTVAYAVHDGNQIDILGFGNEDFAVGKIDKTPILVSSQAEQ